MTVSHKFPSFLSLSLCGFHLLFIAVCVSCVCIISSHTRAEDTQSSLTAL
jgi:uncharacterized membrane protein YhdT